MSTPETARPGVSSVARERLKSLLLAKSVKIESEPVFKLASGRMSDFYVDCRKVTLDPEGLYLIGTVLLPLIRSLGVQAAGGLTLGADPIAIAVSMRSQADPLGGKPILPFVVRKEPKKHGTASSVEGNISSGMDVAILEDVITTGGSALKAAERMIEIGARVLAVVALVDREEGGRENIAALHPGIDIVSVYTASELKASVQHPPK